MSFLMFAYFLFHLSLLLMGKDNPGVLGAYSNKNSAKNLVKW